MLESMKGASLVSNGKRKPELGLLSRLYEELYKPFVGREEEAKVLVLSLVSGEHSILIGEPGTAKSALARRLASLIEARFFKYLLTKFTEPGELLGPLDIAALKEGVYRRITEGKLPTSQIAFLDEVFNASSAVLNSLLSLLQERVIYDGYGEIRTNVWTIIGASNNIPSEPELEALYDRFLYRHFVKPVEPELLGKLLDSAWMVEKEGYMSSEPIATLDDIIYIYNNLLFTVKIDNIKSKLIKLFLVLEEKGIHLTDRRKGKTLKAVAAHALLRGETTADIQDLIVLRYIAPRDEDDLEKVNVILFEELKTKERILFELNEIMGNLEKIEADIGRLQPFDPRLVDYYKVLKELKGKVVALSSDAEDEGVISRASEVLGKIEDLINNIMIKLNM